jgi:hypothetical protein
MNKVDPKAIEQSTKEKVKAIAKKQNRTRKLLVAMLAN